VPSRSLGGLAARHGGGRDGAPVRAMAVPMMELPCTPTVAGGSSRSPRTRPSSMARYVASRRCRCSSPSRPALTTSCRPCAPAMLRWLPTWDDLVRQAPFAPHLRRRPCPRQAPILVTLLDKLVLPMAARPGLPPARVVLGVQWNGKMNRCIGYAMRS
jgi:hypothetical protein